MLPLCYNRLNIRRGKHMRYTFKHELFNNFSNYEVNKLKARSYHIPFADAELMNNNNYLNERYNSDMITLLNGEWQFKYYKNLLDVTEFDSATESFDKITVPSCWQFTGYEEPFYLNSRYQFPVKPPRIPQNSPVGVYRKNLKLNSVSQTEIISFLGVCSNITLYVNGQFVGYSEGSHNTCEFDITKFLQTGDNEILCLVYKFCNGSYLEAQDMFRNNGIFRDVYLTHYSDNYIYDYAIKTEFVQNGEYKLTLAADVFGSEFDLVYIVKHKQELIKTVTLNNTSDYTTFIKNVKEWSAEKPNLYTLIIELYHNEQLVMTTRRDFGFKHIIIKGNVYYFNNQPIKFKGVNHHDTDQSKGYCMTADDYIRDAKLMKQLNVNSVRTSHYPPDPIFIMIAEHYGLYIVDEADIETHGVGAVNRPNWISNNIKWRNHYWDRVRRMYERDKNSVSVALWSLGNESGGWLCHDYCYNMLKQFTDIPIHYEGVINCPRFGYDVLSGMYHNHREFERFVGGKLPKRYYKRPYMQCEYAHAMGVGPGSLEDYWELFYQSDSLMGGMIWEWADHAVLHNNDKYKYKYTYGGDHGEFIHDDNFCVDGLVFPDRTPHTGAYEMKNVYRTTRAKIDGKKIIFRNTDYFKDTMDTTIHYKLLENGLVSKQGNYDLVLPPQTDISVSLTDFNKKADTFLIIEYMQNGIEVGHEQFALNSVVERQNLKNLSTFKDNSRTFTACANGTTITFNKSTGFLTSIKDSDNTEYINCNAQRNDGLTGLIPCIYRAYIDNYRTTVKKWKKQHLNTATIILKEFKGIGGHQITTTHAFTHGSKELFNVKTIYSFDEQGCLKVDLSINSLSTIRYDMPKFGVSLEMPKQFENIEYYGQGDKENYSDMWTHSLIGIYKDNAHNMLQKYIRPQDSGNRSEVRWAKVTDKDGKGLMFIADGKAFNFNCIDTTLDNLEDSQHLEDLKIKDANTVNIDGFMRGLGSNSCGPDTLKKYKMILNKKNKFQYSFIIKTVK